MPFETNVFINCPFDNEYKPLLKSLVFTILYLDFNPILSETLSSGNIRVNQIKGHIRNSKYGIHDLSRSRPMSQGEFPRLNMPYELGLDVGAAEYGNGRLKSKRALILDTERYHYQRVLSDIAGQDIENHNDNPHTLIIKVRNWISTQSAVTIIGPIEIWTAFNQFNSDLGCIVLILSLSKIPRNAGGMPLLAYIFGAVTSAAIIPSILWVIKYYISKKKSK